MAYRKCPSCGSGYNGKRCKNCLYEPFGEVRTSYDLHREEAVPKREVPRREVPRRSPAYPTQNRRKSGDGKSVFKLLGTIWAVILLLTGVLPVLFEAFADVGSSFVEATPEPVPLPKDGIVIYEDADILVLADWDGSSPIDDDVLIFVQNFTGKDLTVCTDGVAVNGCMTNDVFFYCDAYRNSVSMATLWVDMEILGEMGIKEVQSLQMAIDVMDVDTYENLVDNAMVSLGEDHVQELSHSGTVLYDQDGFQLIYQGWDEDAYGEPRLRFYARNDTQSAVELSSDSLLIDGEDTGCYLWQKFFPETQSVIYGNLYDFDLTGTDSGLVELNLYLYPEGGWTQESVGILNFHLN